MTNWRYKVDQEDIILTQAEHDYVRGLMKGGKKGHVFLRNNDDELDINIAFIRFFKSTEKPTDMQQRQLFAPTPRPDQKLLGGQVFKMMDHREFLAHLAEKTGNSPRQ
jgi:hypothetical protein